MIPRIRLRNAIFTRSAAVAANIRTYVPEHQATEHLQEEKVKDLSSLLNYAIASANRRPVLVYGIWIL